jgi:exopolysaccharide production repressor protein
MYAPRVFLSMVCVLLVFAAAAYWLSGSASTVIIATIVCAVLLQVGYFVGILFMVRQEKQFRDRGAVPAANAAGEVHARDDIHADVASH